jgi:hypothetical protein
MISVNDILSAPRQFVRFAATSDALVTGPIRIYSVHVSTGSSTYDLRINDALTAAGGGTTVALNAAANDASQSDFPGGIRFSTGLSATIAGAGTGACAVTYKEDA